jgi:hypothetical protein
MLSSYPVHCPHEGCDWSGNVVPSHVRGGESVEVASMDRAWFRCPRCKGDWEVQIKDDRAVVVPAVKPHGGASP